MSDRTRNEGNCGFGFDALEGVVRAAGTYVRPTEDLRPRTLEAARSEGKQRVRNRRFGSLALSLVLLAVTGLPGLLLTPRESPPDDPARLVREYNLHQQASLRSLRAGLDPTWAIYEAFLQLRNSQAELFDEAN